ncbi:MAG: hypothetical protein ACLFQX_08265 [Candidatus Kapaibacterium sp.]
MDIWIECFRAGEQTDSAGNTHNWTVAELDEIVRKYNEQSEAERHEAPIVLGHPEDDSPAYGWVKALKREGDTLMALLTDMKPEFMQWVKDGHYRKRSIALFEDNMLRHIGFLGGMPPAVRGLADPEFSKEKKFTSYEFTTAKEGESGGMIAKLQSSLKSLFAQFESNIDNKINQLKNKEHAEMNLTEMIEALIAWASETLGEEVSQQLAAKIDELGLAKAGASGTEASGGEMNAPDGKEGKEGEEEKESKDKFSAREQALQLRIAELERRDRKNRHEKLFNELLEIGKVLPAQKDLVMANLEVAGADEGSYKFAFGGKTKEQNAFGLLTDLLNSYAGADDLRKEFAKKQSGNKFGSGSPMAIPKGAVIDEEAAELNERIRKYMKEQNSKGRNMTYSQAFDEYMRLEVE